jgi:hypothetical protein
MFDGVIHAFDLFQNAIRHFSKMEDLAVCWIRLWKKKPRKKSQAAFGLISTYWV